MVHQQLPIYCPVISPKIWANQHLFTRKPWCFTSPLAMIDHRRFLPIRHRKEGAPVRSMAVCELGSDCSVVTTNGNGDHTKRNWGLWAIRWKYQNPRASNWGFLRDFFDHQKSNIQKWALWQTHKIWISIIFAIYVLPCSSSTDNASTKCRSLQNDRSCSSIWPFVVWMDDCGSKRKFKDHPALVVH